MLYNYLTRRVTKDKNENKQVIGSKSIVYSLFLHVFNRQKAPGAQCIQMHLSQLFLFLPKHSYPQDWAKVANHYYMNVVFSMTKYCWWTDKFYRCTSISIDAPTKLLVIPKI